VGLDELDRTDRIIVQQMAGMTDGCCNYEGENLVSQNAFVVH
jgi:hypothetical protein